PAKARTIAKYLGENFQVLASVGHVRELVEQGGDGVNPDNGFAMKYQLIEKSKKQVDKIARAVKKASAIYLATDPDREGEAISWHVKELLKERDVLEEKPVHRVAFNEITKNAIQEALKNPRDLSMELVSAYQARRGLDYLIGFNLSPLLWRKVGQGLSAGRVQSPALRLIVERESEIVAFKPREYWTVAASVEHGNEVFSARLSVFLGKKVGQFTFTDAEAVSEAEETIQASAKGILTVTKVAKKQRRRNPAAPFITSTLQQEASRKLGFDARKTMMVSQGLYQGIDIADESVGLITYMRTDSVNLANDAVSELRTLIRERYGDDNLPDQPRHYKTTARNAQEAHEAVRPTSVARTPDEVQSHLNSDQARLYDLIWKRTVACQMMPAVFDTVALDFSARGAPDAATSFRANGSVLVKPGYMAVYQEGSDENNQGDRDRLLPAMSEGDQLALKNIVSDQHFTEPPPRYSEATLVRALEEYGIGRPSTYASIISTLRAREYVEMESRRFIPTDIGKVVNSFLTKYFPKYVDYEFTANMEGNLDAISRGEKEWIPILEEFWQPFQELITHIKKTVTREQAAQARNLGTDPASGRPVTVRMGRYGPFIQIGTKDDEEKPSFAGLKPGQKMDEILLDEALDLFQLPRDLGATPEGESVSASIGRFGPYVRYGSKFVSIPKEDDPYTINLKRALELIAEKKIADAHRTIKEFSEAGIKVLRGRYGPYITDGKKNAKIPKERDPEALTLAECKQMIEAAPERRARGSKKKKK
ncbi:MAG: DNA topoisomerase I, partial [Gammaproteobacteria bacterium]